MHSYCRLPKPGRTYVIIAVGRKQAYQIPIVIAMTVGGVLWTLITGHVLFLYSNHLPFFLFFLNPKGKRQPLVPSVGN